MSMPQANLTSGRAESDAERFLTDDGREKVHYLCGKSVR